MSLCMRRLAPWTLKQCPAGLEMVVQYGPLANGIGASPPCHPSVARFSATAHADGCAKWFGKCEAMGIRSALSARRDLRCTAAADQPRWIHAAHRLGLGDSAAQCRPGVPAAVAIQAVAAGPSLVLQRLDAGW
jgi:hypothetical protein